MIASILKCAGFKTATFTSPHLHDYTERIVFDGQPVSQEVFARGVEEIQPFVKAEEAAGSSISTFGVLTALFFHLVKQANIEWQVVEVGMGGRFDATNVFERKDASVITPISLEHIEVLGTNQSEIASNKAGIITGGCITVLSAQKDPAVRSVIGRKCMEVGADLVYVPKSYKIKVTSHDFTGQAFTMESPAGTLNLHTPMLGEHQVSNAATAASLAKELARRGIAISDENIAEGIKSAKIYGRFEVFSVKGKGDSKVNVVLDGAHNHESAAALAAGLRALFPDKKCIFIIGVNRDKNVNAIWRELLPLSKSVIGTRSANLRAMDAESLAEQLSFQTSESHVHPKAISSVSEAIDHALSSAENDDVICVTGSLYVVAAVREHLQGAATPRV
jgi:dihydrofolate synthase/folylpolyglutamate synthase